MQENSNQLNRQLNHDNIFKTWIDCRQWQRSLRSVFIYNILKKITHDQQIYVTCE